MKQQDHMMDEYVFIRRRAWELLQEENQGYAVKLLRRIDDRQAELFRSVMQQEEAMAR